jgi:hypothetical protein
MERRSCRIILWERREIHEAVWALRVSPVCERSVGTVFQLPSPDAIYSRDEEKERKVGRHLMFVFAHGPRAAEAR